jgi:hypothetical protein
MSALLSTLRASLTPRAASEDEDNEMTPEGMEDEESPETSEGEDDETGETGEPEPDAEEGDPDEDAEGDEYDPESEDEDEAPAARKARKAGIRSERARILAILTHPNAEHQPKLATRMIRNGMPEGTARAVLDELTAPAASAAGDAGTLAERVAAHNRGRKPGRDTGGAVASGNRNSLLATVQSVRATRK